MKCKTEICDAWPRLMGWLAFSLLLSAGSVMKIDAV